VRATLAGGEDGIVNTLLKVSRVLEALPEENETSAGTTESLVARKWAIVSTDLVSRWLNIKAHVVVVTTSQYSKGLLSS